MNGHKVYMAVGKMSQYRAKYIAACLGKPMHAVVDEALRAHQAKYGLPDPAILAMPSGPQEPALEAAE